MRTDCRGSPVHRTRLLGPLLLAACTALTALPALAMEHKAGDKTKVEASTFARTMSSFNMFVCARALPAWRSAGAGSPMPTGQHRGQDRSSLPRGRGSRSPRLMLNTRCRRSVRVRPALHDSESSTDLQSDSLGHSQVRRSPATRRGTFVTSFQAVINQVRHSDGHGDSRERAIAAPEDAVRAHEGDSNAQPDEATQQVV